MKLPAPTRSPKSIGLAIALFLIAAGVFAFVERSRVEEIVARPAPAGTPIKSADQLSPDEQAFYDFVVPRMLSTSAEADVLAKLGREKSRNILQLQTRGNRIDRYRAEITDYISLHPVPSLFAPNMDTFFRGVNDLQSAMANSKRAMVTFDWDLVAKQISIFEHGAMTVELATKAIQHAVSSASPAPR